MLAPPKGRTSYRPQTGLRRHCSQDRMKSPGFDVVCDSFDPSSAVHLRSPSWTTPDAVIAAPFHSTLTTMTLNHRSLSWFAAKPCRPAARGLLSSQVQLLLAHGEWREGISPSRSPKTGRESLNSSGSNHPRPNGTGLFSVRSSSRSCPRLTH